MTQTSQKIVKKRKEPLSFFRRWMIDGQFFLFSYIVEKGVDMSVSQTQTEEIRFRGLATECWKQRLFLGGGVIKGRLLGQSPYCFIMVG